MVALAVLNPLAQFFELDGDPLDGGSVYFGNPNANPITSPKLSVEWDDGSPVNQPATTKNGYFFHAGRPSSVMIDGDYSILVLDKRGRTVLYAPNSAEFGNAAGLADLIENFFSNLADPTQANHGSGMVGHGFSVNYAVNTVGRAINDIALQVKDIGTANGNSNAINVMIALMNTGQTLYLPDEMLLDSTVSIVINKAITLRGNQNKRIRFTSSVGGGQRPIRATVQGVIFEDLWFDGALIVDTGNPVDTVYYVSSDASDTIARRCTFTNFPVYRVPLVFLKEDTAVNTLDWQQVDQCVFRNTGGGVLTVTSNTKISDCVFLESTDTAVAFNGMGARHCRGGLLTGCVIVTNTKVGPYLIAIEGAADTTVSGCYVHSRYGQALSAIDVDPVGQTVETLGTISACTFTCEPTSDTDPRNLVDIGVKYKGGVLSGLTLRGVPGTNTGATMLSISMLDHNVSGCTFDSSYTPAAQAASLINYAAGVAAGTLSVSNNQMDVTRAQRVIGSNSPLAFAAGSGLIVHGNTLINNGAICMIIVDQPANGGLADPSVVVFEDNPVIGTAIGTKVVSTMAYNSQDVTYGRRQYLWSNPGSTGLSLRSPAAHTGINFISDSVTAAGVGWRHYTGFSSSQSVENILILGNGNVQNANNSYSAISDERLKQDITDAASQWEDVKAMRVRKYRFRNNPDGPVQIGLVSQEVECVSPGLVTETENIRVNDDGEAEKTGETTKGVAYSVLYMKAFKALQEAMERIEQLELKVADLEG